MMAVCECVAVLAACVEAHPVESATAMPRVIAAVTDQVCKPWRAPSRVRRVAVSCRAPIPRDVRKRR